jgi:crotonobetainyl-CoA:carnitine CoA-transferase CaiB-like acyl-CoA transferase
MLGRPNPWSVPKAPTRATSVPGPSPMANRPTAALPTSQADYPADPALLADLGLGVAVVGTGRAAQYCAWALRRLGVRVGRSPDAMPHAPLVVDGNAAAGGQWEPDTPAVVRTWDFQVGLDGDGALASAASGVSWVLGMPRETPALLPLELPEKWTGLLAASLVLTALIERRAEPAEPAKAARISAPRKPVVYDVSAADLLYSLARQNFGNHIEEPDGWRRNGRSSPNHGGVYPQGFFDCADGFVAAVARSRRDWESILAVLGEPAWAARDSMRDPVALAAQPSLVEGLFRAELRKFTRDELLRRAIEQRATLAPVFTHAEATERRLVRQAFNVLDAAEGTLPFDVRRIEPRPDAAQAAPHRRLRQQQRLDLPLDGIRVIEMCWIWAGPLIGQWLADLGAEVIKVEWYDRADPYRTRGIERRGATLPSAIWRESSPSFHSLNRNKVGFTVDLKSSAGHELLLTLAAQSDALICNYTSGTLARLGLTQEALALANPDIAVLSAAGYGSGTPMDVMPAYGLTVSALAGIECQIVAADGQLVGSPTFVVSDPNAALFSLLATLAALVRSSRCGGSTAVELSQLEAAMSICGPMGAPGGPADRSAVRIVPTAQDERFVAIDTAGPLPVAGDLAAWCATRSTEDIVYEVAAAHGRAVAVYDLESARSSATYGGCDVDILSSHPVTGPELLVAAPWRILGRRAPLRKTAPALGEGVDYVLRGLLRLPEDHIKRLLDVGVVTQLAKPRPTAPVTAHETPERGPHGRR